MVFDFESATNSQHRLHFSNPCALELAWQADEVLPALQRIEQAVQQGAWAAGYIAYEAAAGLDPAMARAMQAAAPTDPAAPASPLQTPLLAFALFTGPE